MKASFGHGHNIKLLYRALLLAFVPLVCQVVLVSVLWMHVRQFEAEMVVEEQAKVALDSCNHLVDTIFDIVFSTALLEYGLNGSSQNARQRLISSLDELSSARDQLKSNVAGLPGIDTARDTAGLNVLVDTFQSLHNKFLHGSLVERIGAVGELKSMEAQLPVLLDDAETGLRNILWRSDQIHTAGPEAQFETQNRMQVFAISACLANLLVCCLLAVFISRSITFRLLTMAENTLRLADGKPLHPPVAGSDEISEVDEVLHRMAAALVAARAQSTALVSNANEVVCSLDGEARFVRINPACRPQWGYRSEEMIGAGVSQIMNQTDYLKMQHELQRLRQGPLTTQIENTIKRKDGTTVDAAWSVSWSSTEGEFFCVIHDITKRNQAQRLKQEFLMMISNDLRTPLSAISMAQNALTHGAFGVLPAEAVKQLTQSNRNIERMVRLVNDLLDAEKLESRQMQLTVRNMDVQELITSAVHTVSNFAEQQKLSFKVSVPADLRIDADSDRLNQVLVNLISNAIKFSPANTTIYVDAAQATGFVEIRVRDEGPGIPEAYLNSIFERFKQVDGRTSMHKGTGLGLAICKLIVEAHGGIIGVDSQDGEGSDFWFRIPVRAQSSVLRDAPKHTTQNFR